jgi:hypothetical protein
MILDGELSINCQEHGLEILILSLCASFVQQGDYLNIYLYELGHKVIMENSNSSMLRDLEEFLKE